MALSKVEQDYRRLLEQAVAAFHAGDRRRSADKYLEAFRNSPSDWTKDRYHTLHGYTSVLRERYFEPSQEDFNALATIGDSKHEPHVYRSEAMWTLGLLKSDLGKRQYCADLYRSAIHLIDTAKPKERKKTVMASLYGKMMPAMYKVEEILRDTRKTIQNNLTMMETQIPAEKEWSHNMRSDGTAMENVKHRPLYPLARADLLERIKVGGNYCDCCKKTLKELGVPQLESCARCKLTYYCSRECQKEAWSAGHKQACRKKHQIKQGDVMQLFGLKAKPELNSQLVDILGPDPNNEGRWKTRLVVNLNPQGDGTMSIATEKLKHIRPVA